MNNMVHYIYRNIRYDLVDIYTVGQHQHKIMDDINKLKILENNVALVYVFPKILIHCFSSLLFLSLNNYIEK